MWEIIERHDLIDDSVIAGVEGSYKDGKLFNTNIVIHLIGAPKVIFPAKSWAEVKKTIDNLLATTVK